MKTRKSKITCGFIIALSVLIHSGILMLIAEAINQHNAIELFGFIFTRAGFFAILCPAIVIALVTAFISLITTKLWIAVTVTDIIVLACNIANAMKIHFRSEPLYAWDLSVAGEAFNVLGSVGIYITGAMIIGVVYLAVSVTASVLTDKFILSAYKTSYPKKLSACIIPLVLAVVAYSLLFSKSFIEKQHLSVVTWNQVQSYKENGFFYSFLDNYRRSLISEPEGYGEQAIKEITDKIEKTSATSDVKPNVIVIMSEAFTDLDSASNIKFSETLTPNFNKLSEKYISGYTLTKEFGGGTANSEFEVLTGLSASYLPSGTIAYTSYVNKKTDSYISFLKGSGYTVTAAHPYLRTFFSRENAYKNLGIEEFYSEESFTDAERIRKEQFVSDESLTDKIIGLYEQNLETGKRFFNHSVSMQNHSAYWLEDYDDGDKVQFTAGTELSTAEKNAISSYATGIHLSDKAFGRLIDYFEKTDDPTVIVFFGDHSPYLTSDTEKLLGKIGFTSGDEAENTKRLYSTPYLIWNNYEENPTHIEKDISMFELLPHMTKSLGLEHPVQFDYINGFSEVCNGFTNRVYLGTDGTPVLTPSDSIKEKINEFEMIEYDLLLGKRYSQSDLFQ